MNQTARGDKIEEQNNDQRHRPASKLTIQERRPLASLRKDKDITLFQVVHSCA